MDLKKRLKEIQKNYDFENFTSGLVDNWFQAGAIEGMRLVIEMLKNRAYTADQIMALIFAEWLEEQIKEAGVDL